jgi:hypothetical protein
VLSRTDVKPQASCRLGPPSDFTSSPSKHGQEINKRQLYHGAVAQAIYACPSEINLKILHERSDAADDVGIVKIR